MVHRYSLGDNKPKQAQRGQLVELHCCNCGSQWRWSNWRQIKQPTRAGYQFTCEQAWLYDRPVQKSCNIRKIVSTGWFFFSFLKVSIWHAIGSHSAPGSHNLDSTGWSVLRALLLGLTANLSWNWRGICDFKQDRCAIDRHLWYAVNKINMSCTQLRSPMCSLKFRASIANHPARAHFNEIFFSVLSNDRVRFVSFECHWLPSVHAQIIENNSTITV